MGDDGAAKVQHALDVRRSVGNSRHRGIALDFLDAKNVDSVQLFAKLEGEKLTAVGGQPDLLIQFLCRVFNCSGHARLLLLSVQPVAANPTCMG
jgi:hypothetical protein